MSLYTDDDVTWVHNMIYGPYHPPEGKARAILDAVLPAYRTRLILALAERFLQDWPSTADEGIAEWMREKAEETRWTPDHTAQAAARIAGWKK